MSKLWERQPREGSLAFAAFTKYLEMGPDRTLPNVAGDPELGMSEAKVRGLSRTWKWRDRVNAWEDYLADAQRKRQQRILENDAEKWARRRVELREQEYTLAEKLFQKANEILELDIVEKQIKESVTILNSKGEEITIPTLTVIKPVRTSIKDATAALNTGSQIKRLSAEMETSRDRLDINISDEEKNVELARAALKTIREEMVEKLIREHPDSIPEMMNRIVGWIAERFGVSPDLLEENHEPMLSSSPPKPSAALLSPMPEPNETESNLPIIEAEYADVTPESSQ